MTKSEGVLRGAAILGVARCAYHVLLFFQFAYFLYTFGSTRITDALIIAQTVPAFVSLLFTWGLIHTFVPLFVDFQERRGEEEAWKFAGSILAVGTLTLIGVLLVILVTAPLAIRLLAPGFSAVDRDLATNLLRYLAVSIVLSGVSGVPRCLYFAHRSFVAPAISSLWPSVGIIACIFLFKDAWGIFAVVAGTIVGATAQTIMLFALLPKSQSGRGFHRCLWHEGVPDFLRLMGPRLATMGIARANIVIDRMFASTLGPAAVSALSYAEAIYSTPLEFLNGTLGPVILTPLARSAAAHSKETFKAQLRRYMAGVAFVTSPVMIVLLTLGPAIAGLFLQRDNSVAAGPSLMAAALMLYSTGIVPAAVGAVLRTSYFALKDTVTPMKVAIVTLALNAVADYILVQYLAIRGLALATAMVQWTGAVLLIAMLGRAIGPVGLRAFGQTLGKVGVATACAIGVMWTLWRESVPFEVEGELMGRAVQIFLLGAVGTLMYGIACWLLRVDETTMMLAGARRMVARIAGARQSRARVG